jgi:DNA-binding CsgD family transcriptional regulator
MFHQTPKDLFDVVIAFFRAGLADNECGIWALPDLFDREEAATRLREGIPEFDAFLASGVIELFPASDWYLKHESIDPRDIPARLLRKCDAALARGCAGLRVCGEAPWLRSRVLRSYRGYEADLGAAIAHSRILMLCTYQLDRSEAGDLLRVAEMHQFSVLRRRGEWEFLESPHLAESRREIRHLTDMLALADRPFPERELLTPREHDTLAAIVRGGSNKEIAREFSISPRTVEFHRANIMRKLKVRNLAELLAKVLS